MVAAPAAGTEGLVEGVADIAVSGDAEGYTEPAEAEAQVEAAAAVEAVDTAPVEAAPEAVEAAPAPLKAPAATTASTPSPSAKSPGYKLSPATRRDSSTNKASPTGPVVQAASYRPSGVDHTQHDWKSDDRVRWHTLFSRLS